MSRALRLLALLLALSSAFHAGVPSALAQGGGSGNVGNGGLGGEPQFRLLRDLLIQWIELGALNIDTRQSPKPVDWREILDGLRTIPFQFDPTGEPKSIGSSKDRACTSYTKDMPGGRRIECNLKLWNQTAEADKLAVVAHEFMGAMGYEPNHGDFSEYWFSSQLLGHLLGETADPLTRIAESSFDASEVRPAPNEVVLFVQSLMGKKSSLTVTPRGTFLFKEEATHYDTSELAGVYLKNGDYLIYGNVWRGLEKPLGPETLRIRQPRCPSFSLELVYSPGLGIRSITTSTGCSRGNFRDGFEKKTAQVGKDGSVTLENTLVNREKYQNPVLIEVNGVKYENRYVHPAFRPAGAQEKQP